LRGFTSKNDTIHANIEINGPKLVLTYEYVWAIDMLIFQLHGFIRSKNIAKSFRGATFFDSHCI